VSNNEVPVTPGSGISFRPNGRFAIGIESNQFNQSPQNGFNRAFYSVAIPARPDGSRYTYLTIWGGGLKFRPTRAGLVEALFRIHLLPTGTESDALDCPVLNVIVGSNASSGVDPIVNQPVGQLWQIPIDPSENFLAVELQEAGGITANDCELQLTGFLS